METRIEITSERQYLFSINNMIGMCAKVAGEIREQDADNSMAKVVAKHMLLSATVSLEEDGTAYFVPNTAKMVQPVYYPYTSFEHMEELLQEEDRTMFLLEEGPLYRFYVFHGAEQSMAVIIAHQLIADAKSLMYCLEDFVYYLNYKEEKPKEVRPVPIPKKLKLKHSSSLSLIQKHRLSACNIQWKRCSNHFTMDEYRELYYSYHRSHRIGTIFKELDKRHTSALIANCTKEGVSLEAALLTGVITVLHNINGLLSNKEINIIYEEDIRKELVPINNRAVSNYTMQYYLKKQSLQKRTFWDNCKSMDSYIKNQLTKKRFYHLETVLRLDDGLIDSIPFFEFGKNRNECSQKASEFLHDGQSKNQVKYINLGNNCYDKTVPYYIDALYMIPSLKNGNDLSLASVVVDGKLVLGFRYNKAKYSKRIVEDMARTAINYLLNRC